MDTPIIVEELFVTTISGQNSILQISNIHRGNLLSYTRREALKLKTAISGFEKLWWLPQNHRSCRGSHLLLGRRVMNVPLGELFVCWLTCRSSAKHIQTFTKRLPPRRLSWKPEYGELDMELSPGVTLTPPDHDRLMIMNTIPTISRFPSTLYSSWLFLSSSEQRKTFSITLWCFVFRLAQNAAQWILFDGSCSGIVVSNYEQLKWFTKINAVWQFAWVVHA